jgi:ribonuclease HII
VTGRRFDTTRLSVQELRQRFLEAADPPSNRVLQSLAADRRKSVQQLHTTLCRRRDQTQREDRRQNAMLWMEREFWRQGIERIAGVDEVGVGPMAGPVVAAAVVFPMDVEPFGVDDSKRLDAMQREKLALQIRRTALGVGVGVGEVEEIDQLNIYHAGLLAMRRALENLAEPPQRVLTDARHISGVDLPQHPVRKGDARVFCIAAASIIAKIWRDDYMCKLAQRYPGYGFERHKGYCTAAHQEAVRQLGPCPVHRRSYGLIREMNSPERVLV